MAGTNAVSVLRRKAMSHIARMTATLDGVHATAPKDVNTAVRCRFSRQTPPCRLAIAAAPSGADVVQDAIRRADLVPFSERETSPGPLPPLQPKHSPLTSGLGSRRTFHSGSEGREHLLRLRLQTLRHMARMEAALEGIHVE